MESKPFNIQSPEQIAKDYGGDKQKIAQAMQMGIVDPTAGMLAGMFIDRMRSAAQAEAAPQTTVAQQVMGGAPAPPTPPPAPAGLGATPEAAAMPQMADMGVQQVPEIPADPMEEAPAAYAGGGLTTLPVPDTMFDEPDGGGYANGGIVAFAEGGWQKARVTSPYGAKRSYEIHPGVDFGLKRGTPIPPIAEGVVVKAASDKVNGNHVIVRHPNGMTTSYLHLDKIAVEPGQPVSASDLLGLSGSTGRSTGPHLHFGARDAKGNRIDPNILLKNPGVLLDGPRISGDADTPESDNSRMPRLLEMATQYREALDKNAPPETKRRDALIAELEAGLDPEAAARERSKDRWAALRDFGFELASDTGPGGLLAKGARSAKKVAADYEAEQKQDRALRRGDITALAELETRSNAEKQKIEALAFELAQAELGDLSREREMALRLQIAQMDDATRRQIAAASDAMQLKIAGMRTTNPSDLDTMLAIMTGGTPQQKAALKEVMKLKAPGQNTAIPGMDGTPATGPWTQFQS